LKGRADRPAAAASRPRSTEAAAPRAGRGAVALGAIDPPGAECAGAPPHPSSPMVGSNEYGGIGRGWSTIEDVVRGDRRRDRGRARRDPAARPLEPPRRRHADGPTAATAIEEDRGRWFGHRLVEDEEEEIDTIGGFRDGAPPRPGALPGQGGSVSARRRHPSSEVIDADPRRVCPRPACAPAAPQAPTRPS